MIGLGQHERHASMSATSNASFGRRLSASSEVATGGHVTTAGFSGGSDVSIDDQRLTLSAWGATPSPRPRLRLRGKA